MIRFIRSFGGCLRYQKIPRIGTLFEIKCNYEKTCLRPADRQAGKILSYYELDAKMKSRMNPVREGSPFSFLPISSSFSHGVNLQGDINYRLLPAQVACLRRERRGRQAISFWFLPTKKQ
jgi:hypothetical protein